MHIICLLASQPAKQLTQPASQLARVPNFIVFELASQPGQPASQRACLLCQPTRPACQPANQPASQPASQLVLFWPPREREPPYRGLINFGDARSGAGVKEARGRKGGTRTHPLARKSFGLEHCFAQSRAWLQQPVQDHDSRIDNRYRIRGLLSSLRSSSAAFAG